MKTLSDTQALDCADAGPATAAAVEQSEVSGHVQRLLAGLSENQQEAVRLRFQNGLSYRDIAAVTGLSVANVGFLIHTAIKTIRTRLGVEPDACPRSLGGES